MDAFPVVTLHSISVALANVGGEAEGLAFLRKVQQRHPGDFKINAELAWWLIAVGVPRSDEAVSYARAALAVRPRSPAALTLLGIALAWSGVARGDHGREFDEEAIAVCREAARIDASYPYAYANLGFALWKNNQIDEAIAAYRTTIRLRPDLEVAHSDLGLLLAEKGLLDESIAESREAIRLYPRFGRAYSNLGWALAQKGLLDEAIDAHRHAIQLEPTYAPAHTNLAIALYQKGLRHEAAAAYRDSVRLNWPDSHTRESNGWGLNNLAWEIANDPDVKRRNPTEAVQLGKEAVAQLEEAAFRTTLGAAQYRAGDFEAAIDSLETAMKIGEGEDSYDWFFLAMSHWQLGNEEAARQWYDKAIDWMERNQPQNDELLRFRTEAQELMALKESKNGR